MLKGNDMCECTFVEAKMFDWQGQTPRLSHSFKWKEHPLFGTWHQMKYRCYSPALRQYPDWGGRGIRVCTQWLVNFETFIKDMGDKPKFTTLDRVDNDKGYCPHNCKWSTHLEQSQNRRVYRTSKTGYSGIRLTKAGTYQARSLYGSRVVLGCFKTLDDALTSQKKLHKKVTPRINNTSGITGVTQDKKTGRWNVRKIISNKRVYLGATETLNEAKELYLSGKKKERKKR